jgi:aspartyl-tRNA(Asn)/glutamyl-tRNA(Gln) amidotransferase subunit C
MALSTDDVRAIADYARIALTDEELDEMTVYMNDAVAMLDQIKDRYGDVAPTFHPIGDLVNVMRPDSVKPGLPTAEALENAASTEPPYFRVPRILGEGAES